MAITHRPLDDKGEPQQRNNKQNPDAKNKISSIMRNSTN